MPHTIENPDLAHDDLDPHRRILPPPNHMLIDHNSLRHRHKQGLDRLLLLLNRENVEGSFRYALQIPQWSEPGIQK